MAQLRPLANSNFHSVTSIALGKSNVAESVTYVRVEGIKHLDIPCQENGFLDAIVSYASYGPTLMFVQLTNLFNRLHRLVLDIHDLFMADPKPEPLNNPADGQMCLAQYKNDGQWYRGCVLYRNEHQFKVKVYFVDYGNEELVDKYCIRQMPEHLLEVPPLAVPVCLYKVPVEQFTTDHGEFQTQLENRLVNIKLVGVDHIRPRFLVSMVCDQNDVSLNEYAKGNVRINDLPPVRPLDDRTGALVTSGSTQCNPMSVPMSTYSDHKLPALHPSPSSQHQTVSVSSAITSVAGWSSHPLAGNVASTSAAVIGGFGQKAPMPRLVQVHTQSALAHTHSLSTQPLPVSSTSAHQAPASTRPVSARPYKIAKSAVPQVIRPDAPVPIGNLPEALVPVPVLGGSTSDQRAHKAPNTHSTPNIPNMCMSMSVPSSCTPTTNKQSVLNTISAETVAMSTSGASASALINQPHQVVQCKTENVTSWLSESIQPDDVFKCVRLDGECGNVKSFYVVPVDKLPLLARLEKDTRSSGRILDNPQEGQPCVVWELGHWLRTEILHIDHSHMNRRVCVRYVDIGKFSRYFCSKRLKLSLFYINFDMGRSIRAYASKTTGEVYGLRLGAETVDGPVAKIPKLAVHCRLDIQPGMDVALGNQLLQDLFSGRQMIQSVIFVKCSPQGQWMVKILVDYENKKNIYLGNLIREKMANDRTHKNEQSFADYCWRVNNQKEHEHECPLIQYQTQQPSQSTDQSSSRSNATNQSATD